MINTKVWVYNINKQSSLQTTKYDKLFTFSNNYPLLSYGTIATWILNIHKPQ